MVDSQQQIGNLSRIDRFNFASIYHNTIMSTTVSPPVNTEIRAPDPEAPITIDNLDLLYAYLRKRLRAPTCFIHEKHPEDVYHELTLVSMTSQCDIMHIELHDHIRRIENYLTRVDPDQVDRDVLIEKSKHFVNFLDIIQYLNENSMNT